MDTVITFEPPTVALHNGVADQFHSLGLDFGFPPYNALPASSQIPGGLDNDLPVVVAAPAGYPGTQVAALVTPTEFAQAQAFGIFTGFHQHVKATLGSFVPESCTVTLIAYDINGVQVGSATATVASSTPPAMLEAASTNSTPNIAYFLIQAGENTVPLWMGNISFDPGGSSPDFNWVTTPLVYVAQGASATETLLLNRLGNSSGDIQFALTGLPSHLSASFSPNPAAGTVSATNLTIAAGGNAAIVNNASFTISATPSSAAVGPQQRNASGQLNVLPPIQLSVPGPSTLQIFPCTWLTIGPAYVGFGPGTTGTIALSISGLPANASYTITPDTIQSSENPVPLVYISILANGGINGPVQIQVMAQSGAQTIAVPLTLQPVGAFITSSPVFAATPQALQPGDTISISGHGFCPGSTVRFGNDVAVVAPISITPSEITAIVPQYATTGQASATPFPFGVIPPNGTSADLIPAPELCLIDSFRNIIGFSFMNGPYGTVTLSQIQELFLSTGSAAKIFAAMAQAFIDAGSGDVCFGMCLATQRLYQDDTGALAAGFPPNLPTSAFGLTGPDDAGGPSASLQQYIRSQHLAQLSEEYLSAYLTAAVLKSNATSFELRQNIATCLQRTIPNGSQTIPFPDYPLVAMRQGLGSGHVVVAYEIVDQAGGAFDILVYDPNDPFTPIPSVKDSQGGEDSDTTGQAHQFRVDHCTIHVTGDGHWAYAPQSDSGTVDELTPVSSTIIPLHPTMLGTTADLVIAGSTVSLAALGAEVGSLLGPVGAVIGGLLGAVAGFISGLGQVLGSISIFDRRPAQVGTAATDRPVSRSALVRTTQLSNNNGHALFDPDRKTNRNPRTRLLATPFAPTGSGSQNQEVFIVSKCDQYRHAVTGIGSGKYGMVLLGGSYIVEMSTSTSPDQKDEFTFDMATGELGFRTGAESAPLTVEVLAQLPDGSMRLAVLATTASSIGNESIDFNLDCGTLTFTHHGPAATYFLVLGSVAADGRVSTFYSGMERIEDGYTIGYTPIDWSSLNGVNVTTDVPLTTRILPPRGLPGFTIDCIRRE